MRWTTVFAVVAVIATATSLVTATPPSGVLSNVIVGQGATLGPIDERAVAGGWTVRLEAPEQSEVYFQDLVIGPGGYTGWHSHPGVLLLAVKEGSVEFYGTDCAKRVYVAGQSFTEGADPHAAVNRGTVNARLLVAYVVKRGEPRRIESPAPPCAASLGIP